MGTVITIELDADEVRAVEALAADLNCADPGADWHIAEMMKGIILSVVITHYVLTRGDTPLQ